jgi:hypothetical protein
MLTKHFTLHMERAAVTINLFSVRAGREQWQRDRCASFHFSLLLLVVAGAAAALVISVF